jgi:RNase H-like domain found in reverse transcriptase
MYNNVQRFLRLIQYLAHYMPDFSAYTTPLAGCVRNNRPFEWTPLLDKCLQSIKALACKVPILRPVDPKNPDPIWVITDGSKSGIGAMYGQGPEWQTCRPAGFLSKKFSVAQ